jgi:hypothetical protein
VNGGRTGCVCGAHAMRACHVADADGGISRDTGPLVRKNRREFADAGRRPELAHPSGERRGVDGQI